MNAVIAEESVLRGWKAGVTTGVGALVADGLFFVFAFVGAAAVVTRYPLLEHVLFVFGGVVMLVFAVEALTAARTETAFTNGGVDVSTGFRKAFVLSVTNPYQLGFWLTVGVGLVQPGTIDLAGRLGPLDTVLGSMVIETGSPALIVGFFAGIGLWVVCYPAALVEAGRRVDAFAPAVATLSGVVLAGFGVLFCWFGVTALV